MREERVYHVGLTEEMGLRDFFQCVFSFTHQRHKLIPKGAEDPVPTQLVVPRSWL